MLDIWFTEQESVKSGHEINHESFKNHLNQRSTNDDLIIFSCFEDDLNLSRGLEKLKSHFHTACSYKGSLRSFSDKFISQACYEFLNLDSVLPIMISQSSPYQNIKDSTDNPEFSLRKVFVNKEVDLSMIKNQEDLASTGYLAVQKHYTDQQQWSKCEEESYNFLRLGKLKNQLDVAEAIIRDTEYIEFNINAIKHSDLPSYEDAPITGLSIEEACQLMKYAGTANRLQFLSICGYDPSKDQTGKLGECIAMLLWYFLEGRESRTEVMDKINNNDFQEFLVQPNHLSVDLRFFKHKVTGQWWVKLPEEISEEKLVLACSERDYYQACNDEVSDRLMQAMSMTL